jgi:hypothetical protein
MSFLNWFSGKFAATPPPVSKATLRSEYSKLKRHARREQLYVGIREAMARAGLLTASYKFKVLSLDQPGDKFMVMMDLAKSFSDPPGKLAEMEALIVHHAKARFEITVPAVYWRLGALAAVPVRLPAQAAPTHHEPIQAEEVAFKPALQAAETQGVSVRSGWRIQPSGFEDTEMPDLAASPALSNTQHGDLN